VSTAKKVSTALSHEHAGRGEVNTKRGWRDSQASTRVNVLPLPAYVGLLVYSDRCFRMV
jgi:hypothetical protein